MGCLKAILTDAMVSSLFIHTRAMTTYIRNFLAFIAIYNKNTQNTWYTLLICGFVIAHSLLMFYNLLMITEGELKMSIS